MPPLIDRDPLAGAIVVAAVFSPIAADVGAVLAVTIATLGHLPRIRVEEAELRGGLGEAYAGYARTTARLVPGL